jgi:cysteine desulfurase
LLNYKYTDSPSRRPISAQMASASTTASRVYLDHNATTPISPAVLAGLSEALAEGFGNASSIHQEGQHARHLVEQARRRVAALLNADPREIVFTSGGTEADNTAILGALAASTLPQKHFITSSIEHPAVLHAAEHLKAQGVAVTTLPVDGSGVVSQELLRDALRPETVLVSIMHANNETGTVQPVAALAAICHEHGVLFHTDAVQSAGKVPLDVQAMGVDFLAMSGHKLFAPKGVGVLYARKGAAFLPRFFGGRHERGRRPGTENVPGIHALGIAAQEAQQRLDSANAELAKLRDEMETMCLQRVPHLSINCRESERLPNTSSILVAGVEGEPLVIALDLAGFAVSSGAACSSGSVEPSHVLTAIGLSRQDARSCLRISLGPQTARDEVVRFVDAFEQAATQLRRIAPPMPQPQSVAG